MSVASHPLRVARRRAGLTLRQLADLTRVDLTKVHHLEYGCEPREDELLRLSGVASSNAIPGSPWLIGERCEWR